jgi:flavin-dependent dehydrogenase
MESAEIAARVILNSIQRKDLSSRMLRRYGMALFWKYYLIFNNARLIRFGLHFPGLRRLMIRLCRFI